jgi:hypothetical protein
MVRSFFTTILNQGCQIFLGTTYQNGDKYTKCTKYKIYHLAVKETKLPLKIPTSSIARPSKFYPDWGFGIKNIPSTNTALYPVSLVTG